MRKLLVNIYLWIFFIVLTFVGIIILPLILLFQVLILSRTPGSALRRSIRLYGWLLVCLAPFRSPVKVEYCNGKPETPVIFVANHNSAIDPYLFGAMPLENGFVTSWPFKIPVYSMFMRLAGYANSEEGWEIIRQKCGRLLREGSSITIWPEGHRSRDGRLGRFKNGAFRLAVETGRPIVPVCILGSGAVLAPGKRLFSPGEITLLVLDPVLPDTRFEAKERIQQLRRSVFDVLEKTLEQNGHFQFNLKGNHHSSGPYEYEQKHSL